MPREEESKGLIGDVGVEETLQRTSVRRIDHSDGVAAATGLLVSEEPSSVTGQVFGVNGGSHT